MTLQLRKHDVIRGFSVLFFLWALGLNLALAGTKSEPSQPANSACRIEPADYKGWHAQRLSNRWDQLILLPQNGGRLIQVIFAGHSYLFVNPKYEGKYLPPDQSQWFNYGGDKLWLLPEKGRRTTLARGFRPTRRRALLLSKSFGRAAL
jgi:hypothetical protein